MFAFLTGLLAGTTHVWVGPDHLAAMAPLTAGRTARAWLTGVRWGIGHSAGVALIGVLMLLTRQTLPLERISTWGERLVGLLLVGVGIWAIRKALRITIHAHEHEHDGCRHIHVHAHEHTRTHGSPKAHRHAHVPLGIGILHGLAGSAHFFGILPMLAFRSHVEAAIYLLAFGIGSILSMAVFGALIGLAARRCAARSDRLYKGLMSFSGGAALIVGCAWMFMSLHGG